MNIKYFIPPVFLDIFRKLTSMRKSEYKLGKYKLEIPANFVLHKYRKSHRLYDQFLPVLAKQLPPNKLIIDVGANIGITTIALLQRCSNPIICIEPSDIFYPYLKRNLKKLTHKDINRVKTFKKLVGTGLFSGRLSHSIMGTAKVIINKEQKKPHIPPWINSLRTSQMFHY